MPVWFFCWYQCLRKGQEWQLALGPLSRVTQAKAGKPPSVVMLLSVLARGTRVAARVGPSQQIGTSPAEKPPLVIMPLSVLARGTRVAARVGPSQQVDTSQSGKTSIGCNAAISACARDKSGNSHWACSRPIRISSSRVATRIGLAQRDGTSAKLQRTPSAIVPLLFVLRHASGSSHLGVLS